MDKYTRVGVVLAWIKRRIFAIYLQLITVASGTAVTGSVSAESTAQSVAASFGVVVSGPEVCFAAVSCPCFVLPVVSTTTHAINLTSTD
jgi:hypothetical protein